MFGLFPPKCPIPADEKTWVERRMLWFAERFGLDRMLKARVVLPTEEFFPERYDADYPSVRRCLDRICGYMDVAPRRITLEVLPDDMMPNAAGWYEMRAKSNICVAESQLADPMRLMATLAHEVAHEILLRGEYLTGLEDDHEQTTDLLPTFLGVGIFGANATIRDGSGPTWWAVSRQGYLSSFVLGYAHALFAFARGEVSPAWVYHLRPDAKGTLSRGLRYLRKTSDSLFPPREGGVYSQLPSVERVLAWLSHKSPTYRIAALWEVVSGPLAESELLEPIFHCLRDRDDCVRAEAAWALASFGSAATPAVTQLVALLSDSAPGVRAGAARSLGAIRANPEVVVPELARLVSDIDFHPSYEAIASLGAFGTAAAASVPQLVAAFALAVANNDDRTAVIAWAISAMCPDPQAAVRDYLGKRDPELLHLALQELSATQADVFAGRSGPPPQRVGIPFPRVHR